LAQAIAAQGNFIYRTYPRRHCFRLVQAMKAGLLSLSIVLSRAVSFWCVSAGALGTGLASETCNVPGECRKGLSDDVAYLQSHITLHPRGLPHVPSSSQREAGSVAAARLFLPERDAVLSTLPDPAALLQSVRPVWWLHVAKCGSSFGNALIHLPSMCLPSLPDDFVYTMDPQVLATYPPAEYCPGSLVERNRYHFADHSALGVSPQSVTEGHAVTMLRQPEQRIISAYLNNAHSWPLWYYEREPYDILEFAKVVSGCAVRMIVRDVKSQGAEKDSPSACGSLEPATLAEVSLAKKTLRESFVFVGITDEWDLSICLLHAVFGGDCLATDFVDFNPGSAQGSATNGTASQYDTSVLHGYQDVYDGALHAEAQSLFREQMQRYGVSQETCQPCFQQASS